MGTLKSAAMEGLGIVSLPAYLCRGEIANGSLVRVLPNWISDKAQLSLMTPSRKGQSPSVRKFSEFLLDNLNDQISD
jgi:DNA-binding transcriptional LysR family regulator